ncbi:extensin [Mesorhizobium plurifarium]|uniref:extensin-like domain-containing protein n=1 Tax=Sinorhizobium arboris TaxID=76745 RepID=UPI00048496DE|nr:extensin family protein [Sinorhizobium arboris]PST22481.1 extensin [Mesorhizobium plurifarium]
MAYVSLLHRPLAALLLSIPLVACTTDVLAPPARIDGGSRVGAIRPAPAAMPEQGVAAYPSSDPVAMTSQSSVAPVSDDAMPVPQDQLAAAGPMTIPSEGVNMDTMLGVEPVVGLAQEQAGEIAEGNTTQPVVAGIGENDLRQLAGAPQPMPVAKADPGYDPDLPPLAPQGAAQANRAGMLQPQRAARTQEPQQVAFIPRVRSPLSAPEYTGEMPGSEVACRQRLKKLGVVFRDVPRIQNGPSCGIDYPIELSGLSGNIAVKPAVKLNCQVTEAFAKWVKYELAPSSRYRYWSGVKTIKPLGGYSCRTMNSRRGNPMSEHARGNAIDVGKFVLKNGKEIDVRRKGLFAFRERGLLKAVRTDSCKYFNTVLGPGSDPFHKDHFHFDLRTRKSGYRHCD